MHLRAFMLSSPILWHIHVKHLADMSLKLYSCWSVLGCRLHRQNTGWDAARMEDAFGGQPRTQEEAASLEAAAAATMQNAQNAMHSVAMNGAAAAAAAAANAGEMAQSGHGMQGHGLPHNMMAVGNLHSQHSGLQGAHGNPYQLPGNPLLPPGHAQSLSTHYQNTGMQHHWPGFNLGPGGLSSSHNLMHAAPSRDTHGDGDQCTC